MIHQRTRGLHSLLILAQIAGALCLYVLMALLFNQTRDLLGFSRYLLYGAVVAATLVVESMKRDRALIRTCIYERSLVKLHRVALRQTLAVLGALGLMVTLLKDPMISRAFLLTYVAALYPVLIFSNKHLPRVLAGNVFGGVHEQHTLIVGASKRVPALKEWMERKADFGFRAVGLLCDDDTPEVVHGLPVLGGSEDIDQVLRETGASQVIVLGLPLVLHTHSHITSVCNRRGVRLMILSDLEERLRHPVIHIEDDGLQFITLRQEPLENPLNRAAKRTLDIAIALPVVMGILPIVSAVVWCFQRRQSPGPLFYKQTRAGIQNCGFEIYKFRTMHHADHDETKQATRGDCRIYPAGLWLRKLSIDELPQVVNVLRGEMSIVGPRPHLIEHNEQFAEFLANYHIRAFVRPGITGLAQVRGFRGEAVTPQDIADRLAADVLYLENWSLFVDLGIIANTAWQMIFPPKTAY